MSLGFKATLFAGALTLCAFSPAYAAAPVISDLPDVTIGDLESGDEATDNNVFVYSNAFNFNDYVNDPDTEKDQLLWSFAEFSGGLGDFQYSINGALAIASGDDGIAAEEASGHANAKSPGGSQINASSDLATFRDIILSPDDGSTAYDDPSTSEATAAAAGKLVRYYVADPEGNVSHTDAFVKTVDDSFDVLTEADGWDELVRDTDFTSDDWAKSGIAWAAVEARKDTGRLVIDVDPAQGKSRIHGWVNNSLLPYDSVGSDRWVRGKFYITSEGSVFDPLNKTPNFRLRVTHENGAVNAAAHFELAQTGYSDPGYEPYYAALNNPLTEVGVGNSFFLRPSDGTNGEAGTVKQSLYRVDYDPVDVPAAAGTNIGALMESYSVVDPADNELYLNEVVLGTYDALTTEAGNLTYDYNRLNGLAAGAGGQKTAGGGGFNADNNFTPGHLAQLFIPARGDAGPFFDVIDESDESLGFIGTTDAVGTDVFGIGLLNFGSVNNADKVRISADTLYWARFYATSAVPTSSEDPNEEVQGAIRFRFQTVASTVSYLLDISPAAVSLGITEDALAQQTLPGVASENPDTNGELDVVGEDGGWYSVVVASPLDPEGIRNDFGHFLFLGADDGPGSAADSAKDVTLGVDFIQAPANLVVGDTVNPFARPNRAELRISAVQVYEYPSIDDGGFDYAE